MYLKYSKTFYRTLNYLFFTPRGSTVRGVHLESSGGKFAVLLTLRILLKVLFSPLYTDRNIVWNEFKVYTISNTIKGETEANENKL